MNKFLAGIGLCAFACATTAASADTIDLSFDGVTGGGVLVEAHYMGGTGSTPRTMITTAGMFQWNGGTVQSFCIELTQYVGDDTYTCTELGDAAGGAPVGSWPTLDATEIGHIANLFENHSSEAMTFSSPASDADLIEAAAFQFALWEIVYEGTDAGAGTWDASSGDTFFEYYSDAGNGDLVAQALAMANDWLDELATDTLQSAAWLERIIVVSNGGRQDQVILVPFPAPLALGSLGVLGVMIGRRRFR